MTDAKPDEWLIYTPPKSVAFGHQARVRDARKAWKLTHDFLTQQTDFVLSNQPGLTCYEPTQQAAAYAASARTAAARALFGRAISARGNQVHWKVQSGQLSDAINFALEDEKFPLWAWHPTELNIHYLFTWKNLEFPLAPIETRNVRSSLGVSVGGGSVFLQPRFVFPAAWNSEILRTLLAHIEPASPFRFRDQYFQRWLSPSRKGSFGRTRKLDKNWRSSWQVNGARDGRAT